MSEYNNTVHDTTKFSPRFLLIGQSPFESQLCKKIDLSVAREKPRLHNRDSHEMNKKYYDLKHKKPTFQEGDLVLIRNPRLRKLEPRFLGPFKILQKLSENSYRLNIPRRMRVHNILDACQMSPYRTISADII